MSNVVMGKTLRIHLDALREKAVKLAMEAAIARESYEEARLFTDRAAARLPEDHPLHPLNYNKLFSAEYISLLGKAFEEQEEEVVTDPEAEQFVGIEEVQLPDDYKGFDVNEWNEKAFAVADDVNAGQNLEAINEEYKNTKVIRTYLHTESPSPSE